MPSVLNKTPSHLFWPRARNWREIFQWLNGINRTNAAVVGQLFEVFCKHFLLTNPRFCSGIKHVWLQREVAQSIKRRLNLTGTDYGYDLVIETRDGKFGIVQCKFTSHQAERRLH